MPGLPRKSSKNQFSKLMKKSGKSKTNTKSGAFDTSKIKISTKEDLVIKFDDFKIFENESLDVYYEIRNLDRYGEEKAISISEDFNPYSLEESLKIFLRYEHKYRNSAVVNLILKKLIATNVDIEQAKMEVEANKYNL